MTLLHWSLFGCARQCLCQLEQFCFRNPALAQLIFIVRLPSLNSYSCCAIHLQSWPQDLLSLGQPKMRRGVSARQLVCYLESEGMLRSCLREFCLLSSHSQLIGLQFAMKFETGLCSKLSFRLQGHRVVASMESLPGPYECAERADLLVETVVAGKFQMVTSCLFRSLSTLPVFEQDCSNNRLVTAFS